VVVQIEVSTFPARRWTVLRSCEAFDLLHERAVALCFRPVRLSAPGGGIGSDGPLTSPQSGGGASLFSCGGGACGGGGQQSLFDQPGFGRDLGKIMRTLRPRLTELLAGIAEALEAHEGRDSLDKRLMEVKGVSE